MKDPLNRTKVVIRHLPPSLSQSAFFEQIDVRFSGRYTWSSFRTGNTSHKNQRYARAYVNFNRPDDVYGFAEFFDGHVFVNEKDPEYVEFLEFISKPVENLPSADIQLERREAERAGIQEVPIVTPLMEYVRKKRAAKSGNQHVVGSDVKAGRRSVAASLGKSRSNKHISEKKKYILRSSGKSTNGKDKSAYILVAQRENQLDASGKRSGKNESGNVSVDTTKKRILLLKGKEQEVSQVSDGTMQLKVGASAVEASPPSGVTKLNQRHDASGRIIRSILLNKETHQNQSPSSVQTEHKLQAWNSEKGKQPPRLTSMRSSGPASTNEQSSSDYNRKRSVEDKSLGSELHVFGSGREKQDRRTRSRERLDRGVWTPLRRSDSPHAGDGYQTNPSDSCEAKHGESKFDNSQSGHSLEIATPAGGRNSSYTENGSQRHFGRRGPIHSGKEDVSSKRGGTAGFGLNEKQVWVQKSASGS